MSGIAEGYKSDSVNEGGSKFLKGSDFDSGLVVEAVSMEKFTPSDAKYGVKNTYGAGGKLEKENWFVKKGILEEGQSFQFTFIVDGVEKKFDNSSLSFYFAFTNLNPAKGDKIKITRKMESQTKVEWEILKQ